MIVKLPAGYDVSHWKEIPDFKAVSPRPVLFITKATEAHPGTIWNHTDDKFERFFQGMMEIGVIRGAYHFFRSASDPIKQADHFVQTISRFDILPTDILILDAEEINPKAPQLWAWLNYVKTKFPNNLVMLYSRKNILDSIAMTFGEREFFKTIPIWTAGYPYFPDLFGSVPAMYIPDQSKFGEVYLWQYSEVGQITGIIGGVDLNWVSPKLLSIMGSNEVKEVSMATWTGRSKVVAKVWRDVGLLQVASIPAGTDVSGDQSKVVSGVKYLHVTTPANYFGWTKAEWFNYTEGTPPPPPPPPEEPTIVKTHQIDVYSDGKISVDGNPLI